MKTLIKNINLVNADGEKVCDILINNNIIEKIGSISEDADKVIDGTGKIAFPGLCDIHCHLRDPGYTYKEDIESGSKSAAKGGFTRIVAMPNTKPVADSKEVIEYILGKAKDKAVVKVAQAGAISKGLKSEELEELISDKAGLWLDSGKIFGDIAEQFQRIVLACPRSTLEKALGQLKEVVDNL